MPGNTTVVVVEGFSPAFVEELQAAVDASAAAAELVCAEGREEVVAALRLGAQGYIGDQSLEDVVGEAPGLRWAHVKSAGVETEPVALLAERGVTLTNSAVIYGPQLADHVMALVLAFSRQLSYLFEAQREQRWASRSEFPAGELDGQTLLVVGLGGAGEATARRASAFGMRVLATRRNTAAETPPFVDEVFGSDRATLHTLLPRADFVAVCCGLHTETHRLFGAEEFSLMKESAAIVTVARGAIIDSDALVEALRSGTIAGAGLDVTDPEPLPPGHSLWTTPNTVITPHASGHSPNAARRLELLVIENVQRFCAGEELRNVVSPANDGWEISEEEKLAAHEAHEVAKRSMAAAAKPRL